MVEKPGKRGPGRPPTPPPFRVNTVRAAYEAAQEIRKELRDRGVEERDIPKHIPPHYIDAGTEDAAVQIAADIARATRWLDEREFKVRSRPKVVRVYRTGVSGVHKAGPGTDAIVREALACGIPVREHWAVEFRADQPERRGFAIEDPEDMARAHAKSALARGAALPGTGRGGSRQRSRAKTARRG